MSTGLTAIAPDVIRIIAERPDGSGQVEMPILSVQASIDLSKTASSKGGFEAITRADLLDAVRNFAQWPGPVPIHVDPHRSWRESAGPADGFIDHLEVRGDKLWARFDLTAPLFKSVKERRWRGFSVDCTRDLALPTVKLDGFIVAGGVFTNRPAADVHNKVAASSEVAGDLRTLYVPLKESNMADEKKDDKDLTVSLATAEAEVKFQAGTILQLETKLAAEKAERIEAETRADKAEKALTENQNEIQMSRMTSERKAAEISEAQDRIAALEAERKELREKIRTGEVETTATKVLQMCNAAIREGVAPAKIAAFGDFEKQPAKWAGQFTSLEAAATFLKTLPREAALRATASGSAQLSADDSSAALSPEIVADLKRRGLDPKFASLTNANDLNALNSK